MTMAINSNGVLEDKIQCKSRCSSKTSNLSSCRLIKINFAGSDSCSSSRAHKPNNNKDIKSPYFTNDKAQLLCRVPEKKVVSKKPTEIFSSFPLVASVYKANSDEFKSKRGGSKKVKKSVLTLPNEPVPMPNTHTVSDLNDSEYFNSANDSRDNKPKKRRSTKRPRLKKARATDFCNRDARYCSQLNIDLDCSSSEVVNVTGDGKRVSKLKYKSNKPLKSGNDPYDVWAMLRNINKFEFIPSHASQESVVPLRKKRYPLIRKCNNRNDTHFIETCRTEEFAYITSIEVDNKTRGSCSPSSSLDRVTVIDRKSEQDEIMQQFSQSIFGSNVNFEEKFKSNISNQVRGRNKLRLKNRNKKVPHIKKKIESSQVLTNDIPNKLPQLEEGPVSNCNNKCLPETVTLCKLSNTYKSIEQNCHVSDNSCIKENDTLCNIETNNFQKVNRTGDKYKFNCNVKSMAKSPNINVMNPIGDPEEQLSGITKVILSKGREVVSSKLTEPQRKLALTQPKANVPKLSQLEIKRRLANQKFPIVILGKDQITNRGIYVSNEIPPQFDGLDNHIWPFMLEWSEGKYSDNIRDIQNKDSNKSKISKVKHKNNNHDDVIAKMDPRGESTNYPVVLKKVDECKKVQMSTLQPNNYTKQLVNEVSSQVCPKSKPLSLFKTKMFQFLHKNPTKLSDNDWSHNRRVDILQKNKGVGPCEKTQNYNSLNENCASISIPHKEVTDKPVENRIVRKTYSTLRHPWAKGKWTSDFIENIIKKVRSGVYYGVDRREYKYRIVSDGTEVATQTEINASKNACCQNGGEIEFTSNPTFYEDNMLVDLPGFDKTLTTLEIETIGSNKIAVKHCLTNVVVQFDIQVLSEVKNVHHSKNSMSFVPINLKDNQEKVFKCNTSIINAILPAELCSIIPSMMQNILAADNQLIPRLTNGENVQPHLINQSQFAGHKSSQIIRNSILPITAISDKITPTLNGRFSNTYMNKNIRTHLFVPTKQIDSIVTFCPTINTQVLSHFSRPSAIIHLFKSNVNTSNTQIIRPNQSSNRSANPCMALQLYEPRNHSIVPFLGFFSITDFMKQIADRLNVNEFNKKITTILCNNLTCNNSNIMFSRQLLFAQGADQTVLSPPLPGKVGIISLFKALKNNNEYVSKDNKHVKSLNSIDTNCEKNYKPHITSDEIKTELRKKSQLSNHKILRKKSYVRWYRKCNSMSSISSYKCTPLNRVTNLEEFCQVLGSNLFCSVLDGCLENKILGAVEEMKNWIADLSPKQALLILLLTNKKDTPNLIRFRSVLLQGIAVNRITKAVELDTEIEVIEKENFHKLSQASDYQKTFDESSEKLLKSLLQKRKKLNPSYLRVMARYVGLGLLTPKKL